MVQVQLFSGLIAGDVALVFQTSKEIAETVDSN